MTRILASRLLCLTLLAGCVSPSASAGPTDGRSPDSTPVLGSTSDPSATSPSSTEPTLPPPPGTDILPVRASARTIGLAIAMAPAAQDGLFVALPAAEGTVVVALLDATGRSSAGWPVALPGAATCGHLLPVADGSVRLLCRPDDLNQDLNSGVRAYAFDGSGRALPGWPVDIGGFFATARVIGEDLVVFTSRSLGDVEVEGQPSADVGLVIVAPDGRVTDGARVTEFDHCCTWDIGPDGVAYGTTVIDQSDDGRLVVSRIMAVDSSGPSNGWPVAFDGVTSRPAFGPGGTILVAAASVALGTTRILSVDGTGGAVADRSPELRLTTVTTNWQDTGGCSAGQPMRPVVAADGSLYAFSEEDTPIVGVAPSLEVLPEWPIEPAAPIQRRDEREIIEDAYCPYFAIPAAGPDSTLYLPLMATDGLAGGHLSAVGPDGQVRPGWPVTLTRAGGEFWSVLVAQDGTVYALAIEPEARSWSATILAIRPESTVIYSTTIVEP